MPMVYRCFEKKMAKAMESCVDARESGSTEFKEAAAAFKSRSSAITLSEVNAVIGHAKLDRSELKSTSQVLSFSSNVNDSNVLLLELNPTLLDCLTRGESLVFRGDKDDHAVLCTGDKTYSVKEADTSNSLLLLEDLTFPESISRDGEPLLVHREVLGVYHRYLEVTHCKPRLRRVWQLLGQNPFKGREYEDDNLSPKFTFEDLLDRIQASERELRLFLREIDAYEIDGSWRVLDSDYSCRLLTHMLNLMEENSWSFTSISKRVMLDTLENLEPRSIIEQCLDLYGSATDTMDDNGDVLYRFDENKICRFFAKILLKPAGKFNLQEFWTAWNHAIPDGMTTNFDQLEGIALIDRSSLPEIIFSFPVSDLPEGISERFDFLFNTKPKWTYEEICPFIKCFTINTLDVSGLLTKYARVSVIKGVRQYSSKKQLT